MFQHTHSKSPGLLVTHQVPSYIVCKTVNVCVCVMSGCPVHTQHNVCLKQWHAMCVCMCVCLCVCVFVCVVCVCAAGAKCGAQRTHWPTCRYCQAEPVLREKGKEKGGKGKAKV